MSAFKPAAIAAALLLLSVWPALEGAAQPHERAFENHVLRSSAVSSMAISEAAAAAHDIRRASDLGILNVTVLKKASQLTETVPAKVNAYATDLSGARRTIEMRETKAAGWVSYTGTFPFAPREVLDFSISAQPEDGGPLLEMSYRERIWHDEQGR